jgi:hypothetical protein
MKKNQKLVEAKEESISNLPQQAENFQAFPNT